MNKADPKLPVSNPPRSHGEMLINEHQAGRLSATDMYVMMAIHAADRLVMFNPLPYPDLPPVLREYAIARVNGVRETRDPDLNRQIGMWTNAVRKISHQNGADVQFFKWILEYLERAGMVDRFLGVQAKIAEYERNQPVDEDLANKVQELDGKAKHWEGR